MVTPIGNSTLQARVSPQIETRVNRPTQLPSGPSVRPPEGGVSISDEAKKLAAARAVRNISENPVAVAAVADNPQVDQLATTIYIGQQQQALLDTYRQANDTGSSDSGTEGERSPLAIAAASENPELDELATTVYVSRMAQDMVEFYEESQSNAQDTYSIDDQA